MKLDLRPSAAESGHFRALSGGWNGNCFSGSGEAVGHAKNKRRPNIAPGFIVAARMDRLTAS
jgi:hypothetical protein